MNGLFQAAGELQQFLQERGWRFCIIGGLAVARWGQPRATQDVDVSLITGFGSELRYIDALLGRFAARLSDARQFALESRTLLLSASNGVPLDIALAAFPYEEQIIERASCFEYAPGLLLITASAEDLVVLKAFAGRAIDWADVESIAARQAGALDWPYIVAHARELLEIRGDADSLQRLLAVRDRAGR